MIAERLHNQKLVESNLRSPATVVAWMGAVQAQEFEPAKWALGQRALGLTSGSVERAFASGSILRTHVLRPTWHFVTPADIRWMLALTGPRIGARIATYNRQLELDARLFARSHAVLERALAGGTFLTRAELGERLARKGIAATGPRLGQLMMQAEIDQVICSGPRRGKAFTYALLAERAPAAGTWSREAALATLAARYFRSHGPATLNDFCWWSGLTMADVRQAVELARPELTSRSTDGRTCWSAGPPSSGREGRGRVASGAHLLPIYDEYFIAYKDRALIVPGRSATAALVPGDPFVHQLMINGRLAGGWRRDEDESGVRVRAAFYVRPTRPAVARVTAAGERLARFLERPVKISIS